MQFACHEVRWNDVETTADREKWIEKKQHRNQIDDEMTIWNEGAIKIFSLPTACLKITVRETSGNSVPRTRYFQLLERLECNSTRWLKKYAPMCFASLAFWVLQLSDIPYVLLLWNVGQKKIPFSIHDIWLTVLIEISNIFKYFPNEKKVTKQIFLVPFN